MKLGDVVVRLLAAIKSELVQMIANIGSISENAVVDLDEQIRVQLADKHSFYVDAQTIRRICGYQTLPHAENGDLRTEFVKARRTFSRFLQFGPQGHHLGNSLLHNLESMHSRS